MKHDYVARLKTAEDMCLGLNPDEALDRWMDERYPFSRPTYMSIVCLVPTGLRKLCFQRVFDELEREYQGLEKVSTSP